jgi:hypothetical protein
MSTNTPDYEHIWHLGVRFQIRKTPQRQRGASREMHDLSSKIPKLSMLSQYCGSDFQDCRRVAIGLKVTDIDYVPIHQVQ